ncbi:MAG: TetR family transcriptional regulator [Solirubrobacteraceae bacterium]
MSATAHPQGVPYAELTRGLLRDRVLDTVGELLTDRPWAQVTMAEVAAHAGVSRQTVYNAFGSRPALAEAYLGREADRFLAAVDVAVREHAAEPRQALASALEVFLVAAHEHPLVRAITDIDGGGELLPLVTTRGGPLIERVSGHLTGLLVDTWASLRPVDAAPVADALVRLAISYAALPAGDPSDTAATVAGILGPCVDEILG